MASEKTRSRSSSRSSQPELPMTLPISAFSILEDGQVESSTGDEDDGEELGPDDMTAAREKSLRKSFRNPTEVLPWLFLGSAVHARNHRFLSAHGVTHVLCVHERARFPPPSFKFMHCPLSDFGTSDLADAMGPCAAFLDEAREGGGAALVHCRGGVNRSASVVIAYLMQREQWPLARAYAFVKERRALISPHEKYFEQLREMDVRLFGEASVADEDVPKSLQAYLREVVAEEKARRRASKARKRAEQDENDTQDEKVRKDEEDEVAEDM